MSEDGVGGGPKGDGKRETGKVKVAAGLSGEEGSIGEGEEHGRKISRVHEVGEGR